jgi:hypothetical protein
MATFRELASGYVLRIATSADPRAECQVIAREINGLVYESNKQPLSLEDRIKIANLIAEIPRQIRKGDLGYDSSLSKVASSNTDFNEFTQEVINFLGGRK